MIIFPIVPVCVLYTLNTPVSEIGIDTVNIAPGYPVGIGCHAKYITQQLCLCIIQYRYGGICIQFRNAVTVFKYLFAVIFGRLLMPITHKQFIRESVKFRILLRDGAVLILKNVDNFARPCVFFLLTTIMSLSDTFISAFGIAVPKFQTTSYYMTLVKLLAHNELIS